MLETVGSDNLVVYSYIEGGVEKVVFDSKHYWSKVEQNHHHQNLVKDLRVN